MGERSINLDACQLSQGIIGGTAELAPAQRTGGVVILPGLQADRVEVLLAGAAVLQFLILLIHLSEADGAVRIILQIDVLGFLSRGIHA